MASPNSVLELFSNLREGPNELAAISGATGTDEARLLSRAEELCANALATLEGSTLLVPEGGRVYIASYLLRRGVSMQELSLALDWKEFEALASRAFECLGYRTWKNFRLRRPRREIDVIGVNSGFAIALDCKHWQRVSPSVLRPLALKQLERARALASSGLISGINEVLPALLVLWPQHQISVEGVPVVHVDGLMDFILGARGNKERFVTVKQVADADHHGSRQSHL
ncbi:MAG TPA: restriction endonuclease [Conexivisphaerales archaeon]|nr:restriction endonuclease [Conexivisphaerales archaeon]